MAKPKARSHPSQAQLKFSALSSFQPAGPVMETLNTSAWSSSIASGKTKYTAKMVPLVSSDQRRLLVPTSRSTPADTVAELAAGASVDEPTSFTATTLY